MKRLFLLLILTLFSNNLFSRSPSDYVEILEIADTTDYYFLPSGEVSGMVLELQKQEDIGNIELWINGIEFPLTLDPHYDRHFTGIINLEPQRDTVRIKRSLKGIKVYLHLLKAPPLFAPSGRNKKQDTFDCNKPGIITQDIWRQGLPAPAPGPDSHKVEHLIIHHTAGLNNDTDHLKTVRNIYLFHRVDRGWSDIGYNFLIAADGTIYAGRDGQGVYNGDNVRGAHFCGKNSGTMGIALLGHFDNASPTEKSIESLTWLATWKVMNARLDPLWSRPHPTPASAHLGVVSGHREGCATQCPGDSLYILLPVLKLSIDSLGEGCGYIPAGIVNEKSSSSFKMYTENGHLVIGDFSGKPGSRKVRIFDMSGKCLMETTAGPEKEKFIFDGEYPGIYIVEVEVEGRVYRRKMFLTF